ncbi:hypothetical protein [Ralstonia pseudosolanacearum]|uniref:hypothetical protein n=1 Tax=Ralstonia pseudosolanacearum TaxID=1310165 RepID=UPI0018D17FDE|nr:hypothetical protein [Ralstonia pseudosolanacearum]
MRKWLKVSFHQSGACHIKTYETDPQSRGKKDFEWRYPEVEEDKSTHLMRVVYDISKQDGDFQFDDRVSLVFEEWGGMGSVYLDAFFTLSDQEIEGNDENGIIASHCFDGRKWVYFTINAGPPQNELPKQISGMTLHMGQPQRDAAGKLVSLRNSTAVWYQVPERIGTLTIIEASHANFAL